MCFLHLIFVLKIVTLYVVSSTVLYTKNSHQLFNLTLFKHQVISFIFSVSSQPA